MARFFVKKNIREYFNRKKAKRSKHNRERLLEQGMDYFTFAWNISIFEKFCSKIKPQKPNEVLFMLIEAINNDELEIKLED